MCNNSEVPVETLGRLERLLAVTCAVDLRADCLLGVAARDVLGTDAVRAGERILKSQPMANDKETYNCGG